MFVLCSRRMLGLQLHDSQNDNRDDSGDVFLNKRLKPAAAHEPHTLTLLRHVNQLQTHSPTHADMSDQACRRGSSQPASDAPPLA